MKNKLHCLCVIIFLLVAGHVAHADSIIWTNTLGGNWSSIFNWSPNQLPGPGDTAVITNAGNYTVNLDIGPNVGGLVVGGGSGGQYVNINGQTFTINGQVTINSGGQFNLTGGALAGTNVLSGTMVWNGGTISGTTTVATNGLLIVQGDGIGRNDLAGALTNAGTIQLINTSYLRCYGYTGGGQLINLPEGLVDIQDDSQIYNVSYPSEEVINQGTLHKSGGTGVSFIKPPFYNSGVLEVESGVVTVSAGDGAGTFQADAGATLNFNGTYTADSGAVITGAGTNYMNGTAFALNNSSMTISNSVLTTGALNGTNGVISGTLTWTGGGIGGGGTITLATNGLMIVAGGGNGRNDIEGVLTNAGTIQLTNASYLRCYGDTGAGQLINLPGALVNFQDDSLIYNVGYPSEVITNAGAIRKSGGTGISSIVPSFYNSGTLDVQSGTVNVKTGDGAGTFTAEGGATLNFSGNYTADIGAVFNGAGTDVWSGTSFTLNSSVTVSNAMLTAGALNGTNGVISGTLIWTGGGIGGGATITLATNGLMIVSGGGDGVNDLYGALTNAGTIQITNVSYLRCYGSANGGQLINLPGALVDFRDDSQIYNASYPSEEVVNQGTIRKSGGTGTSFIEPVFYNAGLLDAQSGVINIKTGDGAGTFTADAGGTLDFSGTYTADVGAVINGTGTDVWNGTTFTLNSSVTVSNSMLTGGILAGTNGIVSGTLTWTGGSIGGGATLTVATNALLIVAGGANGLNDVHGYLTNAGIIQLTNASWLRCYGDAGGGQLINLPGALVDFRDDSRIFYADYSSEEVINEGTIRKSGGSGISYIVPALYNTGIVDAETGTVSVNGGGGGGGSFYAAANAGINFTAGGGGAAFIGAGTCTVSGGNVTFTGNVTSLVISGGTFNGSSGVGTLSLVGGIFAGTNILTGISTWTGGQIYGATTVATNAVLIVSGGGNGVHDLHGSLTNAGTIQLTNTAYLRCFGDVGGGQVINLPGALVNFQDESLINYTGYSGEEVVNQGTVRKSGGTGVSYIYPVFYNPGTVDVQSGTLDVYTGDGGGIFGADARATLDFVLSYTADSGAVITGAGTNLISGSMFTLNNSSVTASNLVLATGTLASTNGIISAGSTMTWMGGQLTGTLTITSNALMVVTVGGNGVHDLHGSLTNAGAIQLTNTAYLRCFGDVGGGQIINLPGALVNFQDDSLINYTGYSSEELVNQGTIRKSGGTGISYIYPAFTNTGLLDVQSGTISLSGSCSLTGGTLNFGISSLTNFGVVNLSGNPATLDGTVSASLNNSYIPATGSSFAVMNYSSAGGGFTNANLPFPVAWQTNYGATSFSLSVFNVRPVLAGIADQTVNELTALSVTNSASDADAGQTLTYSLVSSPAGMGIDPVTGIISWTPAQTQSPATNTIVVSVTDNGTPPLSATNSFNVVVKEVNVAPVLPGIPVTGQTNVSELNLLTVTNTAGEANIHSVITGYGLVNPPAGMVISTNGVITWTPTQAQSPATNVITTVVTNFNPFDLVNPSLASTNSFTVIVKEVNMEPVLPTIAQATVNELTLLTVTNTATNGNIHSVTTGYALVSPPVGMVISTNGIITWTPSQTESPGTNSITTIVTNSNPYDLANPQLTATNSFKVVVQEVNVAPVLPVIEPTNVAELTLLTVTNTATDSNIHSTVGYTLLNAPAGASIDADGVIKWTPSQGQSPGTNMITTVATSTNNFDLVNPQLSTTNSITVFVQEVNTAPVLPVIAPTNVAEMTLLTVTNTATNSNIHSTITGYALVNPPAGMVISASGIITWTPSRSESPGTNVITTIVTNSNPYDLVNPQLTATNIITVVVQEVNAAPVLPVIAPVNVAELTLLTVTNSATNVNIHSVITGYGLVNPPAGMAIDANGIITWTPSQAESPGTNVITTVVTNSNPYDLVNPQLTATNIITVNVTEMNVAPSLPSVATTNVNELSLLTVTNTATNANIHATITAYELLYPLPGMHISPNGVITWTPGQNQSPTTNVITTVAYNYDAFDLVNPQLATTNNFTVKVNEVNVAPSLPVIGQTNVNELALLTVIDTATNANIHSTVTGYALVNPPAGMSINSSGIITWTPGQAQSPSTNFITAVVTNSNPYDLLNPQLTATNSFTVFVNESNVAPVLLAITPTNVNELTVLSVTNTASESNIHATITGYGLVSPPAGMIISTNGVITWTPSQAQSPGTNNIITVVTNSDSFDTINPQLTATNNFTVVVKEVNTAPVLPVIPTQSVNAQALLTVTNTATNGNIHSIITGYGLVNPPAGMSINSSGIISWTPSQAQGSSTNTVTTVVTNSNPYDLINPQLTATNSFTVVVQAAAQPTNGGPVLFAATYLGAGGANLSGTGVKYFGGALYICGNSSISSGLIARYNTPLEAGAVPVWDNTWPDTQYRDQFFGITAASSGIYAAGPDYTRTSDTVGDKEQKGLVLKYPFTGATGSGYDGDIWDRQTPAPPGAYSYGGGESLIALTLAAESGTNYIYTTGNGQPNGGINGAFTLSKLGEDSTVLWTQTQATPGTDNSAGESIVTLNNNVYVGGFYASASQLQYPVLWKYSSSGSFVWERTDSSPAAYNGITTISNYIYVVGGIGIGGDTWYGGGPNPSAFLVEKWDQNGNQIWTRTYTNSVQSLLTATVNISNRLFAVGYTYAGAGGNAEAVLMEINPVTGDQISSTTFAGASVSMATGIDSDGTNLFVVGSSAGSGNVANQIMLLRYSIPAAVPDITNQPQSLTVFAGTTTNISVGAAGPTPIGYQWYYNNNTALPNATNATLSFAPAITNQTGSYFAVVSNAYGAVTSSVVVVTVYSQNPLIIIQPKSQTLAIGSTARFTVNVTGVPPLSYQWYFNNALYAGATNATLVGGPILSSQAGNYQLVVTNLYGSTTSVVATLSVLIQPNIYGVNNVSNGAAGPKLLLLASLPGSTNLLWASTNLSQPISQWQLIGTVTAGTNGLFQFIDTNTAGISHKFYTMSSFLVPSLPSVTISPQNPTVVIGGAASFTSSVGGTPPFSYQWYLNSAPASGATNTLLAFNPVAANEAGNYQLVVTNSFGSATSAVDQLTVLLQPNLYGFSLGTNRVFTLDLASAPASTNRIWSSTNLINWQVLTTNIPDATGLFQFMDTNTQGSKVKFYRLSTP